MRWGVAGSLAAAVLIFAGLGVAASSFSDTSGDNNEAPDVTSVTVAESPAGTISVAVALGNYQSLPADSWLNLWFDLDKDATTGDEGDEVLARYVSDGQLEFYRWNGSQLAAYPTTGMTASFASGVLTFTAPSAAFDNATTFDLLTIASRSQELAGSEFIASDYVPDIGRSSYVAPAQMAIADGTGDHDGAPDVTAVNVTDAKNGWVGIAISTPNYAQLPGEAVLVISIDRDNRGSTGDGGAEILITTVSGEVVMQRWDSTAKQWILDDLPTRVRVRNSGNVVTVEIHQSELENTPRFGFAVAAFDFNAEVEAILGIDFAPDNLGFYRYALTNKPALLLTAGRIFGTPAKPRTGRTFTVNLEVRRSDTGRGITSGTVVCKARVKQQKVPAKSSVKRGAGRCSFAIPARSSGSIITGTITVRTGGKSITKSFTHRIL